MDEPLFCDQPSGQFARPRLIDRLALLTQAPWLRTLKVRLAGGALLALLFGIALTTWHMSRSAQTYMLRSEGEREHDDAQRTAAVIGHRVAEMQRALRVTAEALDRGTFDDPARLAGFLDSQPVLRSMFAALAVLDREGRIVVGTGARGARAPGVSLADRAYFRAAMQTGRAVISEPVASRMSGEPQIVLAQPLLAGGGPWGVIAGTLSLANRDLLEDLAETRAASDERMIVITDDQGRILAHPQSARLLADLESEPRLAQAARLWRQDGRPLLRSSATWTGVTDVVAMAGEPVSGWHVWSVRSRELLLGPLREARGDALRVAAAVVAGTAMLLLTFLTWQLRPLSQLERRAAALLNGDDDHPWPEASGEIGSLTRTLRHILAERAQIEGFNGKVLQKLNSVMSASPVGLAFMRNERFELVSSECCRLLQRTELELAGNSPAECFAVPDDFDRLREQTRTTFGEGKVYEGEWRLRSAAGDEFWARVRARPVIAGDESAGSIWSLYDITEQVMARDHLRHEALHDPLTGVMNRKGFQTAMSTAFSSRATAWPAAVVMIDLDHFKPVNDSGGHAAGDAMLKAVARAMAGQVRSSDAVARLGGDEFALLLQRCDRAQALAVARKVHQAIKGIVLPWEDKTFSIGASLGIAELRVSHLDTGEWLQAADAACYEAKRAGRNAVCLAAEPALAD